MSKTYQRKKAILQAEMERLAEEHGYITPEMLLDAASPKTSPIHPFFEWNAKKAAEEYRLVQAMQYIRSIKIKLTSHEQGEITTRQFVHVSRSASFSEEAEEVEEERKERKGIYITIDRAQEDGRMDEVLHTAIMELRAFANKYRGLSKLSGVLGMIDDEISKIENEG